jgi:hypothetical protein
MMESLLVFSANLATDILAVTFIKQVTARHRVRAGLTSMAIVALSYCSIILCVQDTFYIFPAMAGCFVGTVCTVGRK